MNIAEIAEMAGVSKAAVSRYLNNGYISEQKREAIRRVVEETGYRPSVQAQTLRTRKTKMIGVIVPKISSTSVARVVEGILTTLNENGYQMLLAIAQNDPAKELEYLHAFHSKQVDGIVLVAAIFTPEHKRMLKSSAVPVVIVGQRLPGYPAVFHDDYHASYDLTRLLLDKGRRKLGYISADLRDQAAGAERYRGFCDAAKDMGLGELTDHFVTAAFTAASGYEKAGEILEKFGGLDGIICASDTIAAGATQYVREHGIKSPDQILMAGHGDSEMARMTYPPLTTVHYFYEKSGETAVQMLMELLEGSEGAVKEIKLGYYIVDRA